jgi:outer membrane protein insertion porin family
MIAVIWLLGFSEGVWAQDMPSVNVIEVKGSRRIAEDVIRERISQRLGDLLSSETVSEDIKAIFGLGYFDDVKVEVEPFEGGVRLAYIVKEKPAIRRVDVYGNEKLDDEQLNERITITPGSIADTVLIKSNADGIKGFYEEKGYPLAVIVPVVRELGDAQVLLTYQIEEGPKVKIKDIEVEGNEEIPDRKIKKAMKTSEWWIFSWVTKGGHYEKATLDSDVNRIKNLYHNEGFIQAEVAEPEVSLAEDKKWMNISVEVAEGERFNASSIDFSGNTVFTAEELLVQIKLRPGTLIRRSTLDRDITAMTEMYSEKGYALASVYPDIFPDSEAKTAKIVFRIHEGDIYRIGRIEISGNLSTRDKVVRRELRFSEGDIFNGKLLKRSYQRINNLKFFEKVSIKPRPHAETRTLDIEVHVEERSTGFLNMGVGYSSVDKFLGMVEVTQANLGGRGQYLKLKSEFGSKAILYELSFRDPWFLDTKVSFNTSVYNTQKEFSDYEKKATGFNVGVGRSCKEYWSANVTYGYETATIDNVDESASVFLKDQEGTSETGSIAPTIVRDSRDNYLDPHTGSRNVAAFTLAGLGGDNRFYKVNLDSTWLIPVTERTHFSVRGRFSIADGFDGRELPLYERYYVGGGRTIRGLRNIGPRDETGNYLGGKRRLIFNVDYIFPLIPSAGIKGEVFYDIGTAYDSSIHLRDTVGVGVRWLSPVGPLKIDWAYNIEPEPDEDSSKFEFTIGTFF